MRNTAPLCVLVQKSCYSNSSSWKDIYASQPARPAGMLRDETFYRAFDNEGAVPSLVTASSKDHSKIRQAYSKAFSKQALVAQEPLIVEHVTCMLKTLCKQENPINIAETFAFVTTDIGVDLQFGAPLHLFDDATHHPWVRNHFGLVRGITILGVLAELPTVKAIFQLALPQLIRWARVFHFGWMNKMLEQRLCTKTNRPDIVHFVMNQSSQRSPCRRKSCRPICQLYWSPRPTRSPARSTG
jgi:cytochrome P450